MYTPRICTRIIVFSSGLTLAKELPKVSCTKRVWGGGENSSLTYTYNWSNNFSSLLLSPLPPNFLSFLSFTSLVSLQYIYADLPVGKEVGALCIIFSHFFFLFNFSSTHSLRRPVRPAHSLDFTFTLVPCRSSPITPIRSGRHSSSTRIGLRRTSFARGSELSSEIAIRLDFISAVTSSLDLPFLPWPLTLSRTRMFLTLASHRE